MQKMEILVENILQIGSDIDSDCHEKNMDISLTQGQIEKIIFEISSSEIFWSPHNNLGMILTVDLHAYVIIFVADDLMLERPIIF